MPRFGVTAASPWLLLVTSGSVLLGLYLCSLIREAVVLRGERLCFEAVQ